MRTTTIRARVRELRQRVNLCLFVHRPQQHLPGDFNHVAFCLFLSMARVHFRCPGLIDQMHIVNM